MVIDILLAPSAPQKIQPGTLSGMADGESRAGYNTYSALSESSSVTSQAVNTAIGSDITMLDETLTGDEIAPTTDLLMSATVATQAQLPTQTTARLVGYYGAAPEQWRSTNTDGAAANVPYSAQPATPVNLPNSIGSFTGYPGVVGEAGVLPPQAAIPSQPQQASHSAGINTRLTGVMGLSSQTAATALTNSPHNSGQPQLGHQAAPSQASQSVAGLVTGVDTSTYSQSLTERMSPADMLVSQKLAGNTINSQASVQQSSLQQLVSQASNLVAENLSPADPGNNRIQTAQWGPLPLSPGAPAVQHGRELMPSLREQLRFQVDQQIQRAELRLDPPELGKVDLNIRLDGDRLHIQMHAANNHIRDALQSGLERLRAELAQDHQGDITLDVGQQSQDKESNKHRTGESQIASSAERLSENTLLDEAADKSSADLDILA